MKKYPFLGAIILTVFILAPLSGADDFYSAVLSEESGFSAFLYNEVTAKPIEDMPENLLSIMRITILRDSFSSVLYKFGGSFIVREDGASGEYLLCNRSSDKGKDGRTILLFNAGPAGGWKIIDGFGLLSSDSPEFNKCIPSSKIPSDIKIGNTDLGLGVGRDKVIALLGPPSAVDGNWIGYIYNGKLRMSQKDLAYFIERNPSAEKDPYYDVTASVLMKFKEDEIVEIWVRKGIFY